MALEITDSNYKEVLAEGKPYRPKHIQLLNVIIADMV